MGKLLEALRRFRADVKLMNGQCSNPECRRILPDNAKRTGGYLVCSAACADAIYWDSDV